MSLTGKLWIVNIIFFMLFIAAVSSAKADGDRNRMASPILPPGENTCVYTIPDGIDLDDCIRVESPDHSQVVFFCDGLDGDVTVICNEDNDE